MNSITRNKLQAIMAYPKLEDISELARIILETHDPEIQIGDFVITTYGCSAMGVETHNVRAEIIQLNRDVAKIRYCQYIFEVPYQKAMAMRQQYLDNPI